MVKPLSSLTEKMEIYGRIAVLARYAMLLPGHSLSDVISAVFPLKSKLLDEHDWPVLLLDHLKLHCAEPSVAAAIVMECMLFNDYEGVTREAEGSMRQGLGEGLAFAQDEDRYLAKLFVLARYLELTSAPRWQEVVGEVIVALNGYMVTAKTPATGDAGYFRGDKAVQRALLVFDDLSKRAINVFFTEEHHGKTYRLEEIHTECWHRIPRTPGRLFASTPELLDIAWSTLASSSSPHVLTRLRRDGLIEATSLEGSYLRVAHQKQIELGKYWMESAGSRLYFAKRADLIPLADEVELLYGYMD